eukprot:m51a1_g6380 hypothetical protein (529) ;mRNA; r:148459-150435
MATLSEEFLADLEGDEEETAEQADSTSPAPEADADMAEAEAAAQAADAAALEREQSAMSAAASATEAAQVSRIAGSDRLRQLLKTIEEKQAEEARSGAPQAAAAGAGAASMLDPEYRLVVEANAVVQDIVSDMDALHRWVRDRYAVRFPELDNLVPHPIEYARAVCMVRNERDVSKLALNEILPGRAVMGIVFAASRAYTPLPEDDLRRCVEGAELLLSLDTTRQKIADFVESRMLFIAPNVSAIVGTAIAARLMITAGGLAQLARMPSGVIQVLGQRKLALTGYSSAFHRPHEGFVFESTPVADAPKFVRLRAGRLVAGKVALAARVDSKHDADTATGEIGRRLREEIEGKIDKWLEPSAVKNDKALPAPDEKPKKRRGGKRTRRLKDRYEMTELRRQQNRMVFGTAEEEFRETGVGFGMLGKEGSGRVRVSAVDKGILRKVKRDAIESGIATPSMSKVAAMASGFASSVAFTPVQGIELANPMAARAAALAAKQDGYFSTGAGFAKRQRTEAPSGGIKADFVIPKK